MRLNRYYNFNIIGGLNFEEYNREDYDTAMECMKRGLRIACYKGLAFVTADGGNAFKGKSIAMAGHLFNLLHYNTYKKWGDNLRLKEIKNTLDI